MPFPVPPEEPRSREQLWRHYQVERELADRLRAAAPSERPALYREVYDELLRLLPDQPMLRQKADPAARQHLATLQETLLEPFLSPQTSVLELGPGDALLASRLAARVRRVTVVDASVEILSGIDPPAGLEVLIGDATRLDLPDRSFDLAFSCHFLEHLHPEDAAVHAQEVHRVLRPGGRYVCLTPNRLWGPHDISRYFDDRPTGLHLREYNHGELAQLLRRAGFATVNALRGIGVRPRETSFLAQRLAEGALDLLPVAPRRFMLGLLSRGSPAPFRPLEQVKLVAKRP